MVIKGIQVMLHDAADIHLTDVYNSGKELMDGLRKRQPDVLILDIQMPDGNGEELTPLILESWPRISILALTNLDKSFHVRNMMENGALGYLLKSTGQQTLIEAIKSVYKGTQYIDSALRAQLLQDMFVARKKEAEIPALTPREHEILQLIGNNQTSQEIADKLFLSKRTVDHHRVSLLLKFEVKNASGLVKKAIDLGIIR